MNDNIIVAGKSILLPENLSHFKKYFSDVYVGNDDAILKGFINKRGIRYKDKATRLSLAASKFAMQNAGLVGDTYEKLDDNRTGVITASCFGNVSTVLDTVKIIQQEDSSALSPLALPNASANIISSTLAIWFGLKGPCLFVANGHTSSLDAIFLAHNLIFTGRLDRVLICGVESEQTYLEKLFHDEQREDELPINICSSIVIEREETFVKRMGQKPLIRVAIDNFHTFNITERNTPLSIYNNEFSGSESIPCYNEVSKILKKAHGAAGVLSANLITSILEKSNSNRTLQIATGNESTKLMLIKESM